MQKVRKKEAAIKIFKQPLQKKQVLEIAMKLRQLIHDNVVRFRGYSLRPSGLAFELCELTVTNDLTVNNVAELMDVFGENEYFNLKERLEILLQSAKGLQYLHNNSIIHKDFKPNNCLVTGTLDKMVVKVADFDDVFEIKNTVTATLTINRRVSKLAGMTLAYLAPEIMLENDAPSKEGDIYSWAISAFSILANTGGMPWKGVIPLNSDALHNGSNENRQKTTY